MGCVLRSKNASQDVRVILMALKKELVQMDPLFGDSDQHDAFEALGFIIERIDQDFKKQQTDFAGPYDGDPGLSLVRLIL